MGGAQAQDVYAGPLSFRSRSRRLTEADVARARTEERSLLRTWVMRMTIHLIPTEDAGWMLPLFEPGIERWSRRRLAQLGVDAAAQGKALSVVERELEREGPLTRSELAGRVASAGVRLDSQARLHMMLTAVVSGIACLGPDRKGGTCLVLRADWLGKAPPFDRDAALAELARRYLRAFGPAGDRDLAYWSGLGLRDVRSGLDAISGEIERVRVGEEELLSLRGGRPRLPPPGQVRMLGNFDTYLLGWKSRDFAVRREQAAAIKGGGGGWIRPVIVRDGEVVGGWRSSRKGGRMEISLQLPPSAPADLLRAIDDEVADISRFTGKEVRVRSRADD